MMSVVGLVLHPGRDCTPAMGMITDWARERNVTVLGLEGETKRITGDVTVCTPQAMAERADLLVSLGGDGTMLRTMRLAAGTGTPVLGVNVGRLGFLAEVDVPELSGALSAIDQHQFTTEPRAGVSAALAGQRTPGLSGTATGSTATGSTALNSMALNSMAFNDIALARIPGNGRIAAVELWVEGNPFVRYAADAVIVATPTGSTAYSFSAGGPIVSPSAEGLLVTPVAPHSAFNRSLFLSSGEKLALTVLPVSGELAIEADGIVVGHARPGDTIDLTLLPAAAKVVRLGRTTFYQRAQRRLRLTGSAEVE
jgi:NAD+ kinase